MSLGYIFDDNSQINKLHGHQVYRPSEIKKIESFPICYAIGSNKIRQQLSTRSDYKVAKPLIHTTAVKSNFSKIDFGTVIMANVVINADVSIGKHCIINTSAVIEHDVTISDYAHISPNATVTGGVAIGEGTQIGAGAVVLPNLHIGKWATIGAGAVVTKNVPDNTVVVGNPAKPIR